MKLKGLIYEDVANYKKVSLFIIFPSCTFKCDKENGCKACQNSHLATIPAFEYDVDKLLDEYLSNPITSAIVCGGLEPMDSFDDLLTLVDTCRKRTDDDIVIYTGYREDEISDKVDVLKNYKNIIIKFGRFRPNQKSHYDEVLGVELVNDEQHAIKLS